MKRLSHLDAVRGLAALVVMTHHAWLSLPATPMRPHGTAIPFLDVLVLGRPAVVLFFVLSGYVLTLYLQASPFAPAAFAVRRLLRILLPYWATIALAYGLYLSAPRHAAPGLSSWLDEQWRTDLSPAGVGLHLLLLAGPRQFPLDHVAWSLVHELRLSLLMPFLVLLSRRAGVAATLGLSAATTLVAGAVIACRGDLFPVGVHGYVFDAAGLRPSLVLTARFTCAFALGSVAATCSVRVAAFYERSRVLRPAALLLAVLLLSQSNEAAMTVGAVLLITAAASSTGIERALALPPCVWLGRVSYSLYLVHLPIMLACAAWIGGALAPAVTLLLAMALSLLAADIMFELVERPSILLSRAAGARLQPTKPRPAANAAPMPAVALSGEAPAGRTPAHCHDHAATPANETEAAPRSARA